MSFSIGFDIFAKDRASPVVSHVGDEFERTGKKMSGFKTAAIAGAAVAGAAIVGFGISAVNKFKEVGTETNALIRTLGGTAETASRMRFAATQSGVSFEAFSKSTGKLSKALGGTIGNAKATAAMAKTLGFNFLDAHGKILPMNDLLPKMADRFKAMPGGAEKTALAMKLFGKSGADMLPFLNKGSEGIKELEKQSDKYGLTLNGKMLASLKASKAGQRDWNATLDGLKVQIGAQVLPIMTQLVSLIRSRVIPIIQDVTGFTQKHSQMMKIVAIGIVALIAVIKLQMVITKTVTVVTKLWTLGQLVASSAMKILRGEQLALNVAMRANLIGVIVTGILLLAAGLIYAYNHSKTFRDIVQGAFHVVATAIDWCKDHWKLLITLILGPFGAAIALVVTHFTAIKTVAGDSIRWVIDHFLDLVSTIVHGSVSAFGWVPGLGGKLKAAARAIDGFKNDVNKSLSETKNNVTIGADTRPAYSTIRAMMQAVSNATAYVQVSAIAKGGQSLHGRQGFAGGTKYAPRGAAWVGENGPELLNFRGGESVTPARQSAAAGHAPIAVHLTVQGSVVSERDLVRTIMSGIEQVQKRLGVPTVFGQQA